MAATIKARGEREALLHSTAEQIRTLLDALREAFGDEADDAEERCLDLVTSTEDQP